jgi:hypothetical protein
MSTADTLAVVAIFIAGCALFATVWQAHLTRVHNRLSVRPVLVWHHSVLATDAGTEVLFSILNCGVGPATVQERFFLVNGHRDDIPEAGSDEVRRLAGAMLTDHITYQLRQHGLPREGSTIPQNGEHVIARIFFPAASPATVNSVLTNVDPVHFHINYQSLYEERFSLEVT